MHITFFVSIRRQTTKPVFCSLGHALGLGQELYFLLPAKCQYTFHGSGKSWKKSDDFFNKYLLTKFLCHSYRLSPSNQASHKFYEKGRSLSQFPPPPSLSLSLSEHKNCIKKA